MGSAKDVADYLLANRGYTHLEKINFSKLNKLLYYAQGFVLAILNKPLFAEKLLCTAGGVVCEGISPYYGKYGFREIYVRPKVIDFPASIKNILDAALATFGQYSNAQLEYFIHRESPWINANGNCRPWESSMNEITVADLKEYFNKFIKE